ncbi:hypothetical protein VMCG_02541 [Cytospora schulzeri]|uniref:Uncharacterized protein n=1 Tax=Cytospora schulzeri TaxID=448051 RepID=A0A423X0R1_9PEZI|nr:hypothetical protein VMCG_02541 [Valsa malicola]
MHPKSRSQPGPLVVPQEDHEESVTHHNFAPMAFESTESDTGLISITDIIEGLPTAVKSSLGPLRTIKRSVSIRGWAAYFYEISSNPMGTIASHETDAQQQQQQQHTTVLSGTSTTAVEMQQSGRGERRLAAQESHSAALSTTQAQAQSQNNKQQLVKGVNNEEPQQNVGINRFCGLQGQLLVSNALSEGISSTAQGHPASDRTDRKAYVQGVSWLIHGLPEDLDQHERTELIRAMPAALLGEAYKTSPSGSRLSYPSSSPYHSRSSSDHRSLMHRTVQAVVAQLLIPFQLMWAYLIILLGQAVQLERRYRVTEQVVRHSGELGYTVGRRGVRLSEAIYSNGGARIGQLVTGAVTYTAEGLVRGISDGIREARTERRRIGDS